MSTSGAIILASFVVVFAVLVIAAARTWRSRTRGQAGTVPPGSVPAGLAPALGSWDGFYVATTRADQPLERITAGGLGFRGRGGVTVHPEGVVVTIAGTPDRFVARDAILGTDRATAAIDRVVESGGLVRLRWTATGAAGATDLDTYFRFPEGDGDALRTLQSLTTGEQQQ